MKKSVGLFLFAFFSFTAFAQPYKYLVMKGGGIRGIAYTGAIKVLEENNITAGIEKVAGTSVGAIVASLFCVGYNASEMEALMLDLDIKTFNDGQWYFLGGQKGLRKKYGWYKGNKLEDWTAACIEEKTGMAEITFMQLHILAMHDRRYKDLYVTVTNLSKQRPEVFSWETQPNMPLKTAVRASASIPLYYQALFMDSLGNVTDKPRSDISYNIYVDGGLTNNYPVNIFRDSNSISPISQYTLGLKLDRPEQIAYSRTADGIAPYDVRSLGSYLAALYNMAIEQLNKELPRDLERSHTIYISTGNLSPRVRRMSLEQKQLLYKNGLDAARSFFNAK